MSRIIAIDGPSGAGKSTIARELAKRIGFEYIDTGAFYRAGSLKLMQAGLTQSAQGEEANDAAIDSVLRDTRIEFTEGMVYLDGVAASTAIRTPQMGELTSRFSARKVVREHLIKMIRDCARGKEVVTEGRDTTTVIFPKAWRKFYVTASTEVRIRRRFKQLRDYHLDVDIRQAEMDVVKRDRRDSERELSPLAKAVDALVIDTSDKSIEESLEEILGLL